MAVPTSSSVPLMDTDSGPGPAGPQHEELTRRASVEFVGITQSQSTTRYGSRVQPMPGTSSRTRTPQSPGYVIPPGDASVIIMNEGEQDHMARVIEIRPLQGQPSSDQSNRPSTDNAEVVDLTEGQDESSRGSSPELFAVDEDSTEESENDENGNIEVPAHQPRVSAAPQTATPAETPGHHEDSSDFKSPKRSIKPTAKSPEKDEDAECCPICFEPWTNSGNHRLASLKCGHLFGQSCIFRWLKGQGGKCPHCNAKAQRKDIRVIYAKALKTLDTTERDRAMEDLEREKEARRKAEVEAAQARLRYQMAMDECTRMRQEIDRQRQQLDSLRSVSQSSQPVSHTKACSNENGGSYVQERIVKISDPGGCRVMAYASHLGTLAISQPSSIPIFPGFGVKKLSTLDFKTAQYVAVHSKAIRDLSFNSHHPDGLMLSCSLDKFIKMTSLTSNTVVQQYQCQAPLWACTWSADDANHFFAGQLNGTVLMFDVRNTTESVRQLNMDGSRSPIVSLQYVPKNPQASFRPGGLIVGQLDRSVFWENKQDGEFQLHALPLEANMTSLHLEENTSHIMATYRPTGNQRSIRHQMYELYTANVSNDPTILDHICTCRKVQTFHGGSTQKFMNKTRLISHPAGEGKLQACAGDEASMAVHIWDAGDGQLKQQLRSGAAVLDVCPIKMNGTNLLAALTEKMLHVYKWC